MKKILSITIAAAALLSIASCQKENLETPNVEPEKTVRVITGEFSNDGTKTTLGADEKTPQWSVGDVIRVLNSTACEDITLTSSNIDSEDASKITFSTTLSGMLYAVYPASATTMTSCTDGNITFTIPAVQDGTFGLANICVASGDGPTGKSIYFSNATAVVEMSVASGVVYANLGAAKNIAGNMTVAMGNKGAISTTTPSLSSKSIFVTGTPSGNKFYMAVAHGETGAVTITCNTSTKSGSIGKSSKTLAMNKIYAMDLSGMTIETDSDLTGTKGVQNGQEFVLIKGSDGKYLKWATQNLAVTESGRAKWTSTNYQIGDYFQWAASYDGYGITEVASQIPANLVIYTSFTNTFTNTGNSFTFKDSKTFAKASAPYYSSNKYTKYTTGDGKTVLEQSDDVANIVLGGTWRMPTGGSGELQAMKAATKWTWNSIDKGYYVTKSGENLKDDKSNALLFFPAAGLGAGTYLLNAGSYGLYWSSSLDSDYTDSAYALGFLSSGVDPRGSSYRYDGFSVRPVSD